MKIRFFKVKDIDEIYGDEKLIDTIETNVLPQIGTLVVVYDKIYKLLDTCTCYDGEGRVNVDCMMIARENTISSGEE